MAAPVFATGDVPTADQFNKWLVNTKYAYKPANETISSNATLQNDDDLFVTVDAAAHYIVECELFIASQAAADAQIAFSCPSGSVFTWRLHSINSSGSTTNDDFLSVMGTSSAPAVAGLGASTVAASVRGLLIVGGSSGTFQLRWAQNTSNASGTSMLQYSYMSLRRVA